MALAALANAPIGIIDSAINSNIEVLIKLGERIISDPESDEPKSNRWDSDSAVSSVDGRKIPIVIRDVLEWVNPVARLRRSGDGILGARIQGKIIVELLGVLSENHNVRGKQNCVLMCGE